MIALSDAGIPFRDPGLNNLPEKIRTKRQTERSQARGNYKMPLLLKHRFYLFKEVDDEGYKKEY